MATTEEIAGELAGAMPEGPRRRLVLLGASNLTKSLALVLDVSQSIWNGPAEVFAALGHGRSYGLTSTLFGRTLPGIVSCGLWPALRTRPPAPTAALITDIGNDLLYDAPVARIVRWVETCLERLQQQGARIVMTLLPVANLPALSPWTFRMMRTMLFPRNRSSQKEIIERAVELNERVRELGTARGVKLVEHQTEWYGRDPIHILWRHRPRAWSNILTGWRDEGELAPARRSLVQTIRLRLLRPEEVRIFGISAGCRQPAMRLRDGTTLWLY